MAMVRILSLLRLVGSNQSPHATASEDKKGEPESKALRHRYKGELGEVRPSTRIPLPLEKIVLSYLANNVDTDGYTPEQLAAFKLFDQSIAPIAATTRQIATLTLRGQGKKALALIQANRDCLESVTVARDPYGRPVGGTPWYFARATCNHALADEIEKLMTPEQVNAQRIVYFPHGWEIETQKRMDRYRRAAENFIAQLAEKRLPKNLSFEQALKERKKDIYDYRLSLRPKLDDPVITMGLIVDPKIYLDIRQLFLDSESKLGGYGNSECGLLWMIGFQSLIGASSAPTAQILIGGIDNYGSVIPPEVLQLNDGTPFYCDDLTRGVGATCVITLDGDVDLLEVGGNWRSLHHHPCPHRADDARRRPFWKTYVEQQNQLCNAMQLANKQLIATMVAR